MRPPKTPRHRLDTIMRCYRRYVPPTVGLASLVGVIVALLAIDRSVEIAIIAGLIAGALGYGVAWLIGRILLLWASGLTESALKRAQQGIGGLVLVSLALFLVAHFLPGQPFDEAYLQEMLFTGLAVYVPGLMVIVGLRWALRRSRRKHGDG